MKAISLWAPWSHLIFEPLPPRSEFEYYKMVETRGWSTKYRGPLAIAVTASVPAQLGNLRITKAFVDALPKHMRGLVWIEGSEYRIRKLVKSFSLGCVLGIVDLKDVRPVEEVRDDLSKRELVFGNYSSPKDNGGEQRYAWFFGNVRKFRQPISAKGNRRMWNWDGSRVGSRWWLLEDGTRLDFDAVEAEAKRCERSLGTHEYEKRRTEAAPG